MVRKHIGQYNDVKDGDLLTCFQQEIASNPPGFNEKRNFGDIQMPLLRFWYIETYKFWSYMIENIILPGLYVSFYVTNVMQASHKAKCCPPSQNGLTCAPRCRGAPAFRGTNNLT